MIRGEARHSDSDFEEESELGVFAEVGGVKTLWHSHEHVAMKVTCRLERLLIGGTPNVG
jgi:hypothetical protein